jgi:hypothetical protein
VVPDVVSRGNGQKIEGKAMKIQSYLFVEIKRSKNSELSF